VAHKLFVMKIVKSILTKHIIFIVYPVEFYIYLYIIRYLFLQYSIELILKLTISRISMSQVKYDNLFNKSVVAFA